MSRSISRFVMDRSGASNREILSYRGKRTRRNAIKVDTRLPSSEYSGDPWATPFVARLTHLQWARIKALPWIIFNLPFARMRLFAIQRLANRLEYRAVSSICKLNRPLAVVAGRKVYIIGIPGIICLPLFATLWLKDF